MKTVFPGHELAHDWAHATQAYGKVSGGSFSFSGGDLYSYSTVIAKLMRTYAFISMRSYSQTTHRHQSAARRAVSGLCTVIPVYDFSNYGTSPKQMEEWQESQKIYYESQISENLFRSSRAKVKSYFYDGEVARWIRNRRLFSDAFGLGWEEIDNQDQLLAAAEASAKSAAAEKKAAKQRRIEDQATALARWKNGENVWRVFEVTALRLKDDVIQTTKGASIPVEHAKKIWPLLKRLKDSGKSYERNGHSIHLGHYIVDSFSLNGTLKVGCHYIPWKELQEMAAKLHLEV